jgi:hypothetical protein
MEKDGDGNSKIVLSIFTNYVVLVEVLEKNKNKIQVCK